MTLDVNDGNSDHDTFREVRHFTPHWYSAYYDPHGMAGEHRDALRHLQDWSRPTERLQEARASLCHLVLPNSINSLVAPDLRLAVIGSGQVKNNTNLRGYLLPILPMRGIQW